MKYSLSILATCLIAMMLLVGCKEGGSGFDASKLDASVVGGSSDLDDSDNNDGRGVSPEPATIVLLGSGLLAYALFRRKKQKK